MQVITIIIYISIYIGLITTSFYILSFIAGGKKKNLLYTDEELPSVSVIIPAYNEEKTIVNTIKSIAASDYPKFEIIVVDDGSKDKTLSLAKKLAGKNIRVFHKKNGGKGTALNFGIAKAEGEIVFTMDADTTVDPQSMKRMVRFFKNKDVMSVTPAIVLTPPKGILQRVQYTEYVLGLFLRKAFASLRAIYVSPGAFSAFRKSFFDKYGGYQTDNITEDLEMSLRIQFKGYHIENCPEAPAYTVPPSKFKELMIQRRRWYYGLLKNLWDYRKIISPKYGDLGTFVIPVALTSIFLSVTVTTYLFFNTLLKIKDQLLFLQSVNFNFPSTLSLNFYVIERFLYLFFSRPAVLSVLIFIIFMGIYTYYASRKLGKLSGMALNLPLFFILFALLFGFWWVVSFFYLIFAKTIKWR